MTLSGVIFDLNGTVLDDEDEYNIAFNRVLKTLGIDTGTPIPHELGIGVKENWVKFRSNLGLHTDKSDEELVKETQEEYLKLIGEVSVKPGFEDFAKGLKDSGVRVALATSNSWQMTMRILQAVDMVDVFDSITTAEEVKFLKPDPELFLVAADKLGVERYECLVIEDAASGVAAAKTAGMKVIAIRGKRTSAKTLIKADLIVEGFSDISTKAIDRL